jgi:hypothetical protein
MKTNKKIIDLLNHGFNHSTLFKLNENQINVLHGKLVESKKEQKEQITPISEPAKTGLKVGKKGGTLPPNSKGYSVKSNADGTYTAVPVESEMKEGKTSKKEMGEKAVSKKQQEFFGVVRGMQKGDIPKKGKTGKAAEEMSKKDVKDFASTKHKGLPMKKETKENYMDMVGKSMTNMYRKGLDNIKPGVDWSASLKERVEKMVDKHITPKISKKDFINFIKENSTKEKEKERTKEKEKERKKPDTPYKPKPGPEKAPKAKKHETNEDTKTAPVKPKTPTIKPGTKPRPDTPYRPKPGPEKAPKAKKGNLPNWLTFKSIGINLK